MPLISSSLQTALQGLAEHPGATVADCAQHWANAITSYFSTVFPASISVSAAGATLQPQLIAAFEQPSAAPAMEAACTALALTIGAGMSPSFVAVPPPAPVGWAQLFALPYADTSAEAAQRVASAIDAWARTGTATPSIGGSPVPWS